MIRVASVPAGHRYVRHLSLPDGSDDVRRLVDPRPCPAPSDQSVWWPPVMLSPAWVRLNHAAFDVFHLHFGFDAQTVDELGELVGALREHDKPLVYTVHDLRNPHHRDRAAHDAHLDVLVPAADGLVTLTPGAAAVVADRWGRTVELVPHPHVVDLESLSLPRQPRDEILVGIHLKSVRANMDCLPVLTVLAKAIAELSGAVLRVDVHTDVLDPASRNYRADLSEWLNQESRLGPLRVQVHDFFTDEQLWSYLRDEIDVSVLPYRFGTHSGWLEACHDLGTTVVAPSCGFYDQQRPCLIYGHNEASLDSPSLAAAIHRAYEQRPLWRATLTQRHTERRRVAAAHRALYERVLG